MNDSQYIALLEKHLDELRGGNVAKARKVEFKFDEHSLERRTFRASSESALADEHGGLEIFDSTEKGWLIERREPNPEWLYVVDWFAFGWTTDSLKAIRFSRRQDAEQILKMIETEVAFATEHTWL